MRNRLWWRFFGAIFLFGWLAGCTPPTTNEPGSISTLEPTLEPTMVSAEVPAEPGCTAGGSGVYKPEDVRCIMASTDPDFIWQIDEETVVLFSDPDASAESLSGAVIYHIPTASRLVLDTYGDAKPDASLIKNRLALVTYSQLAANSQQMADIKQRVQENWQTQPADIPQVRLGVAWQDGRNTVFLVVLAGLLVNDTQFYCADQTWTIGDEEIREVSECLALPEGALVHHLLLVAREVTSPEPVRVRLALNDVASNDLLVSRGDVTLETAVYQAAISHESGYAAVVSQMTTNELYNAGGTLTDAIDQTLLQTFIKANQTEQNLSYLFLNSNALSLQPRSVIERDYLPPTNSTPDCERFRQEYPGLSRGVITLSQIGFSEDGQQAVLFIKRECSTAAIISSYLVLNYQNGAWQVVGEFGRIEVEGSGPLLPELVYNGRSRGCGDIFIYRANSDSGPSEFITLGIEARAIQLSAEPLTLDLAQHPQTVVARLDLFGDDVYKFGEFPYCNDVFPAAQPLSVWQATSGFVTVSISGAIPEEPCSGEGYEVTVLLENATFVSGTEAVQLDEVLFENVPVGWCAG